MRRNLAGHDDEEAAGEHHHLNKRRDRQRDGAAVRRRPCRQKPFEKAQEQHNRHTHRENGDRETHLIEARRFRIFVVRAREDQILKVALGNAALEFGIIFELRAAPINRKAGCSSGNDEGRHRNHQDVKKRHVVGRKRRHQRCSCGAHRRSHHGNARRDNRSRNRTLGTHAGLSGHFCHHRVDRKSHVGRPHKDHEEGTDKRRDERNGFGPPPQHPLGNLHHPVQTAGPLQNRCAGDDGHNNENG